MIIMLLIVAAVFIIIALMDFPSLIKNGHLDEILIYCVFYILALGLALMFALDLTIPNPIKGAQYLIRDVFKLGYK